MKDTKTLSIMELLNAANKEDRQKQVEDLLGPKLRWGSLKFDIVNRKKAPFMSGNKISKA